MASTFQQKLQELQVQLDDRASVNIVGSSEFLVNTERWSAFNAPTPGAVVNVVTEADVETTVSWWLFFSLSSLPR